MLPFVHVAVEEHTVSLRGRLVAALLGLFAVGLGVYATVTYQAFARAELDRLDEQLLVTLPLARAQLLGLVDEPGADRPFVGGPGATDPDDGPFDGPPDDGPLDRPIDGPPDGPFDGAPDDGPGPLPEVLAPGTYAQLRDASGSPIATIQVVGRSDRPDLSDVELRRRVGLTTVPTDGGDGRWRVAARRLADGGLVIVAVPLGGVERALGRLLAIELVAGGALLVLLGTGAWAVLRRGLRPLERMAAAAGSITAGSLDQRVPTADTGTEVDELGVAINRMLDDLEVAFHEREATEARLRRFLADASHELRTPLTSIQGYAELFRLATTRDDATRDDTDPDADATSDIDLDVVMERIESESARMRQLVEDLLTLARLDEARPAVRERVDLAVLAADALSDAAAGDPSRPVSLHAPTPVPVDGVAAHLRQAVANLVTNAVRHTPAGTAVEVAAIDRRHVARLVVRDHGPGLDDDTLRHAFDRFWQADTSRVGSGAGLGLSIVQAIAGEHGGTVTATNHPDGGAEFVLELPRSTMSEPTDAR